MVRSRLLPRSLVFSIAAITIVPLASMAYAGWLLFEYERAQEAHEATERLEQGRDAVVAALQRALADTRTQLAGGVTDWPDDAVELTVRGGQVEARPASRLAFVPVPPALIPVPAAVFAESDVLARRGDRVAALTVYRQLSGSPDAAVRAGAYLRIGNGLAEDRRHADALAAYGSLQAADALSSLGDVPLSLVGRYAQCLMLQRLGREQELRDAAQSLLDDLASGRWRLAAAAYTIYRDDATTWGAVPSASLVRAELFAEAAEWVWRQRMARAPSGQTELALGDWRAVVVWQQVAGGERVLVAGPEFVERQWLRPALDVGRTRGVVVDTTDGSTRPDTVHLLRHADAEIPWTLLVRRDDTAEGVGTAERRWLLLIGFGLLACTAVAASLTTVRAVRREVAFSRLRSDFVAAVSHEFRTPLTSMRQFTDMLRENRAHDEERRRLCYDAQKRATERLSSLVESLLDFSSLENGRQRFAFVELDVNALVQRVVEDFRAAPDARTHSIAVDPGEPAIVRGDGEALARALWNLLDNAVKYSPGQPCVNVQVCRTARHVHVSVRDSGIGIRPGERRVIFEKFRRGEAGRRLGIKGTGLGLALVNGIVGAHAGHVRVDSAPGRGTVFTIVLPMKE